MRRKRIVALVFCLFLIGVGAVNAQDTSATPNVTGSPTPLPTYTLPPTNTPSPLVQHVVRPGENLYRIALRYGTTVAAIAQENGITNPALIRVGATLRIPGVAPVPTPVPVTSAPTPVPPQTTNYTVRPGDTLFRIALNNHTTVAAIVALNNIPNRNVIYVGQVLKITASAQAVSPANTAALSTSTTVLASGAGYARGIEVYMAGQDAASLVNDLQALGVSWVKIRVNWRDFEPVKGQIDFTVLDGVVDTLSANQFKILFTVSKAPDWSRSTTNESGPSDNVADFAAFMDALAKQYAGRVAAYEIWDEPNLRREWNSTVYGIDAKSYMEFLSAGYAAVKAADPAALVISAGLAPTGFNDGVNAADDRLFLRAMYAEGLANVSDGVGAHPNGWANPPDALCCAAPVGVETHYEDPRFYFLSTLNDYRQIMSDNQDGSTAIWVTKFGWGSSEDLTPPSQTNVFVSYTSLGEQGIYDARAFELGAQLGFVGPMFLYNLNGCQVQLDGVETCYYSLLGPDASPRPVYSGVQALHQGGAVTTNPNESITAPTPELLPTTEVQPIEPPTQEALPFEPEVTPETTSP